MILFSSDVIEFMENEFKSVSVVGFRDSQAIDSSGCTKVESVFRSIPNLLRVYRLFLAELRIRDDRGWCCEFLPNHQFCDQSGENTHSASDCEAESGQDAQEAGERSEAGDDSNGGNRYANDAKKCCDAVGKVAWSVLVNSEETHGEHVAEATDESFDAVFGLTEFARVVLNDDFGDFESLHSGESRNHSVQFTEESDVLGDFPAVAFETAVVVVKVNAAEVAEHAVEDAAWQNFVPWVVTNFFPSADQVITFLNLGDESRDFVSVVLQVGVHREDELAASGFETHLQGGGFSSVAAELHSSNVVREQLGQAANHFP